MSEIKGIAAGNSKEALALRRLRFVERYLVNGRNGREAAMHVGCPPDSAASQALVWLKRKEIKALVDARTTEIVTQAVLNTERWAKEMAAIGHFDPGELYDEDGALIPVHKLPENVRRAIASVKRERRYEGKGDDRVEVVTEEIKLNDKNTALANIGRHLGTFEKDNRQQITAIQVNVTLVG